MLADSANIFQKYSPKPVLNKNGGLSRSFPTCIALASASRSLDSFNGRGDKGFRRSPCGRISIIEGLRGRSRGDS